MKILPFTGVKYVNTNMIMLSFTGMSSGSRAE